MQTLLNVTETDETFDETKIESQVNVSLRIPFCFLPEIKIYDRDISASSQADTKVYPYKPR